ncbi:MAG: V-type ATP synthase subunit F [Clostridiales bacterium]|jgi:V/A-type H+-transporting ATPase subunit F|nr:V-type ATP synthase subunit F [Clostridiales bacterium]
MEKHKIAVIGDRTSVLGFRALGLETIFAQNAEEASQALHTLAREKCAIIYITEDLARHIPEEIARYADETIPAVILIPGRAGSLQIGMTALSKSVERAVGANLLGDEDEV